LPVWAVTSDAFTSGLSAWNAEQLAVCATVDRQEGYYNKNIRLCSLTEYVSWERISVRFLPEADPGGIPIRLSKRLIKLPRISVGKGLGFRSAVRCQEKVAENFRSGYTPT
jgi:hypothetical protein